MLLIPYRELTDRDNVILHSGTIHISNTINLKQKQSWLYMVYRAFPNLGKQRIFRMYQSDLMKAINYTSDNKEHLRELLRGLADCKVEFNLFNKDGSGRWLVTHLLASCEIIENQGIIEYEFSEKLEQKLINPLMYAKLNLLISKRFKSKHALNIYMLAMDYLVLKNNYGEKIFTVEEVKFYLGFIDTAGNETGKYRVVDIHKHILKKAEAEINKISDMNISIETVRKNDNRTITGFRFKMSIKEAHLQSYKTKNSGLPLMAENQLSIDQVEITEDAGNKKELIKIENKILKKFFSNHNISTSTDTVQGKFREIIITLSKDSLEPYLLFLMQYAERENKKGTIQSFPGFFIGLLKDDTQIDNYIYSLEKLKQVEEEKRIKLESLIEGKLRSNYENFLSDDFRSYLEKNIEVVEEKFIEIMKTTVPEDSFINNQIVRHNKGIIDRTLITGNLKTPVKLIFYGHLTKYKTELGYIALSYEEWKNTKLSEETLTALKKELEKEIK